MCAIAYSPDVRTSRSFIELSFNNRATSTGSTSISLLNASLQCWPLGIGDASPDGLPRTNVSCNVHLVIPSRSPEVVVLDENFLQRPRQLRPPGQCDPIRHCQTFLMPLLQQLR